MTNGTGTIEFKGANLVIEYYHEPFKSATYDHDAEGEFWIESVKAGGEEIFELLSFNTLEELEREFVSKKDL